MTGGYRLVARFIAGELVKATNTSPEWVKKVFGRELVAKQSNRRSQRWGASESYRGSLLVPQGYHRIDVRRPPRWDIAGAKAREQQKQRRCAGDRRIERTYAIKQST